MKGLTRRPVRAIVVKLRPVTWLYGLCLRLPARVKPLTALLLAHEQHLAVYKTFLQSFALGTGCCFKMLLAMNLNIAGARS